MIECGCWYRAGCFFCRAFIKSRLMKLHDTKTDISQRNKFLTRFHFTIDKYFMINSVHNTQCTEEFVSIPFYQLFPAQSDFYQVSKSPEFFQRHWCLPSFPFSQESRWGQSCMNFPLQEHKWCQILTVSRHDVSDFNVYERFGVWRNALLGY